MHLLTEIPNSTISQLLRFRSPRSSHPQSVLPQYRVRAPPAFLSSLAPPSPVSETLIPAGASWNEIHLTALPYQQLAGCFEYTVKTNACNLEVTFSCVQEVLSASSSVTNTPSDITHIHCLLSLARQHSPGSSFIPRHSSMHSSSLSGSATLPPLTCLSLLKRTEHPQQHSSHASHSAASPQWERDHAPEITNKGGWGKKYNPVLLTPTARRGRGRSTRKTLLEGRGRSQRFGSGPAPAPSKKPRGSRAAALREPQEERTYLGTPKHSPVRTDERLRCSLRSACNRRKLVSAALCVASYSQQHRDWGEIRPHPAHSQ